MELDQRPTGPHVLIFPLPAQSHVTTTLKFAELLCLANFHITFLNSNFVHNRLLRHTTVHSRFRRYPRFRFKTITDGLPEHHPRSGAQIVEMFDSLNFVTKPLFRELAVSAQLGVDSWPPLTCIVADGLMNFATDIAKEIGVMAVSFRTINASCYWAYFCVPKLIEANELPLQGSDMDMPVTSVPGMEGCLRRRDIPGYCRVGNVDDKTLQFIIRESQGNARADALMINTFEELEAPALSQIRNHIPNTYAIGPLHTHLSSRLKAMESTEAISSNSTLWEEDRSCITWLDKQPPKSVLYVSFGSIAVMTRGELMEFWYGLANSGKRFLWVMRPESVVGEGGEGKIPAEIVAATNERGYMVGWAPQEEVLSHEAIGGFWTHSGWNSTLESIVAGVPMMCWCYFADQMMNSRLVSEVWKLGFDMKDRCDRVLVEKTIRDLMGERKDEFVKSASEMGKLARASVNQGGSSYCNLDRLIEDIRKRSLQ